MSIHHVDETSRSGPHRRVEKILDKMRIAYESEQSFPPYSVDIYLAEWHLGIEVDGPTHSPKKDEARDEKLREKYFLPVLHLKTADHLRYIEIVTAIEDFIIEWAKTGEQRKSQWVAAT